MKAAVQKTARHQVGVGVGGVEITSFPGGREFRRDSLCHCWAHSSLLAFSSCCRQKADQSVLGVCFIVSVLRSASHKGRGRSPRDKQMMVIYGARYGGVIWIWVEPLTRKDIKQQSIYIFHMIAVCHISASHRYLQAQHHLHFRALLCP